MQIYNLQIRNKRLVPLFTVADKKTEHFFLVNPKTTTFAPFIQ